MDDLRSLMHRPPCPTQVMGKGNEPLWVDKKQFLRAAFSRLKHLRQKDHPLIVNFHFKLANLQKSGK